MLVAPDKFKGSLSAARVADHVITGLRRTKPGLRCTALPLADGGDGTVDAAVAAGFRLERRTVPGPAGEPVDAAFAVRGDTAIVELAQASGLTLAEPAPLHASTDGTGMLIREAAELGCRRIVLGVGGSATTDGGSGIARALGIRLLDGSGHDLAPGGAALRFLDRLDFSGYALPDVEVVLASDVDNPLLGPSGASAVFGPQKGACPEQLTILEDGLARWARIVESELGVSAVDSPGAGAAGGAGFGAIALLGASVEPGIGYLIELLGFDALAREASLVITGEGSLDAQTLRGKVPVGVATAAAKHGVPVIAVAGRCTLGPEDLRAAGLRTAYPLTDVEPDERRCILEAGKLLESLAERIPL
ncbi:MAG: glycerate kinase [Pseudonocardiaceae bacterium]|nr:glycerate kinase [Pseudonocardiaceae bacterium]